MIPPIAAGVDHVLFLVRDLPKAIAAWERIGFAMTPVARHSRLKTVNSMAMLADRTYLELISIETPCPENEVFAQALENGEGAQVLALRGGAEPATGSASKVLHSTGLVTLTQSFGREVRIDGRLLEARFTISHLSPGATPGARAFCITQHTPELVWLGGLLTHTNGASGLKYLAWVTSRPEADAIAYAALMGCDAVQDEDRFRVGAGNLWFDFFSAAGFEARYARSCPIVERSSGVAMVGVALEKPARFVACLNEQGVEWSECPGGGICVEAMPGSCTLLHFCAA